MKTLKYYSTPVAIALVLVLCFLYALPPVKAASYSNPAVANTPICQKIYKAKTKAEIRKIAGPGTFFRCVRAK